MHKPSPSRAKLRDYRLQVVDGKTLPNDVVLSLLESIEDGIPAPSDVQKLLVEIDALKREVLQLETALAIAEEKLG